MTTNPLSTEALDGLENLRAVSDTVPSGLRELSALVSGEDLVGVADALIVHVKDVFLPGVREIRNRAVVAVVDELGAAEAARRLPLGSSTIRTILAIHKAAQR